MWLAIVPFEDLLFVKRPFYQGPLGALTRKMGVYLLVDNGEQFRIF